MTSIKERISQLPNILRVKKNDFFHSIEVASSGFRGSALVGSVSSDIIVKITTVYSQVNPLWLLYGDGSALSEPNKKVENPPHTNIETLEFIKNQALELGRAQLLSDQLEARNKELETRIVELEARIKELEETPKEGVYMSDYPVYEQGDVSAG